VADSVRTLATVAIILVNWNGWRDSIDCIRSCLALDHHSKRIILCDNASADGSAEIIIDWARGGVDVPVAADCPLPLDPVARPKSVAVLDRAAAEAGDGGDGAELIVVRTGGNLGFAGGNNVGMRWALARGMDYVWLLNNDTVVPTDSLTRLVAAAELSQAGIVGGLLADFETPDRVQAFAGALSLNDFAGRHLGVGEMLPLSPPSDAIIARHPLRSSEVHYPVGASILAAAPFLRDVGLMEEGYFLYYEEADWVLRNAGRWQMVLATDSIAYHRHGASAGSSAEGTSIRSLEFLYRSRLRAAAHFAPERLFAVRRAILWEAARALARGSTAKWRAAWRVLRGRMVVPELPVHTAKSGVPCRF
jgi:GT2 family glycosyltransferase